MLSGKEVNVGDIVKMKKAHPCGSDEWELPVRYGLWYEMLRLRTFCDVGAYQVRKGCEGCCEERCSRK